MNKTNLRKLLLLKRQNFSNTYIETSSLMITNKVIEFLSKSQFQEICLFLSTKYEVQTKLIIDWCWQNNIKVYVPKVLNDHEMVMIRYLATNHTSSNRFKIYEPINQQLADLTTIDCVFTPLVGFDTSLNRIGMGKGFYDRFFSLNNLNNFNYLKVGLAFNQQLVDHQITTDSYDVKLDLIITETKIYS
ncbi:5-formyltetrahydrofolate cyclo-ligase [Mycoplasma putrefaciens]|uniref:5-formyltetrahydrofolate cyclo-ligase n=1 Tax=Mycoplasma putrefaciens Mput9231 TaxID=1292033 RepID=M9WDQ2_9MOLU|nr:5-formyltetrahydrofolate cyclo-ligase [Mycoplasma putrefaciens]AGJ90886.1 5-formyltetrahydrofolate cyclo-ligase [Mycoplasma putrefaciens Mput9231]